MQYEAEIFKLESQVALMEAATEQGRAAYAVAVAQLIRFKAMKTELNQ